MGRILAIDYGSKRCGIAVTDELRIIASPLDTVHGKDLIDFLKNYCSQNKVDVIVFGKPVDMSGKPSETEKQIIPVINQIKKVIPEIEIDRWDERFTSKMATKAMIEAGSKKSDRKIKGNIDKVNAAIILQDYLTYKIK